MSDDDDDGHDDCFARLPETYRLSQSPDPFHGAMFLAETSPSASTRKEESGKGEQEKAGQGEVLDEQHVMRVAQNQHGGQRQTDMEDDGDNHHVRPSSSFSQLAPVIVNRRLFFDSDEEDGVDDPHRRDENRTACAGMHPHHEGNSKSGDHGNVAGGLQREGEREPQQGEERRETWRPTSLGASSATHGAVAATAPLSSSLLLLSSSPNPPSPSPSPSPLPDSPDRGGSLPLARTSHQSLYFVLSADHPSSRVMRGDEGDGKRSSPPLSSSLRGTEPEDGRRRGKGFAITSTRTASTAAARLHAPTLRDSALDGEREEEEVQWVGGIIPLPAVRYPRSNSARAAATTPRGRSSTPTRDRVMALASRLPPRVRRSTTRTSDPAVGNVDVRRSPVSSSAASAWRSSPVFRRSESRHHSICETDEDGENREDQQKKRQTPVRGVYSGRASSRGAVSNGRIESSKGNRNAITSTTITTDHSGRSDAAAVAPFPSKKRPLPAYNDPVVLSLTSSPFRLLGKSRATAAGAGARAADDDVEIPSEIPVGGESDVVRPSRASSGRRRRRLSIVDTTTRHSPRSSRPAGGSLLATPSKSTMAAVEKIEGTRGSVASQEGPHTPVPEPRRGQQVSGPTTTNALAGAASPRSAARRPASRASRALPDSRLSRLTESPRRGTSWDAGGGEFASDRAKEESERQRLYNVSQTGRKNHSTVTLPPRCSITPMSETGPKSPTHHAAATAKHSSAREQVPSGRMNLHSEAVGPVAAAASTSARKSEASRYPPRTTNLAGQTLFTPSPRTATTPNTIKWNEKRSTSGVRVVVPDAYPHRFSHPHHQTHSTTAPQDSVAARFNGVSGISSSSSSSATTTFVSATAGTTAATQHRSHHHLGSGSLFVPAHYRDAPGEPPARVISRTTLVVAPQRIRHGHRAHMNMEGGDVPLEGKQIQTGVAARDCDGSTHTRGHSSHPQQHTERRSSRRSSKGV